LEDRIRVAVSGLVVRDGSALLVEFSGRTEREHYNFPGGGVELGETLEEALIREVREETSLDVVVERLLLVVESVGSRNTNVIGGRRIPWNEVRFFFLCTPTVHEAQPHGPDFDDETQTGVCWVSLADIPAVATLRPQVGKYLLAALSEPDALKIVPNPHA
jgi:8-oxo-dGTP diphosphatase